MYTAANEPSDEAFETNDGGVRRGSLSMIWYSDMPKEVVAGARRGSIESAANAGAGGNGGGTHRSRRSSVEENAESAALGFGSQSRTYKWEGSDEMMSDVKLNGQPISSAQLMTVSWEWEKSGIVEFDYVFFQENPALREESFVALLDEVRLLCLDALGRNDLVITTLSYIIRLKTRGVILRNWHSSRLLSMARLATFSCFLGESPFLHWPPLLLWRSLTLAVPIQYSNICHHRHHFLLNRERESLGAAANEGGGPSSFGAGKTRTAVVYGPMLLFSYVAQVEQQVQDAKAAKKVLNIIQG